MPPVSPHATEAPDQNSAVLSLRAGKVRLGVRVKVTPRGLVAIGGLVSSILLSTAAVVWVSTSVARRHPVASSLLHRR